MPIPFLLIGAAVVTGVWGAGSAVSASCKNSDARDINEDAQDIVKRAKQRLSDKRKRCNKALEVLGQQKLSVLNDSVTRFVDIFGQLKAVKLEQSVGLEEFQATHFDQQSLDGLRELCAISASTVAGGATAALTGGALTAFGAYSATMAFATASTGTAIAGLSGVAATNATLAWLGGGSLAAGGLGIAGGTAVLGGLVAGPALLIMGGIANSRAQANLDRAHSNRAQAREVAEELDTAGTLCDGIKKRSDLFTNLLKRLDSVFVPLVDQMEEIIVARGVNWGKFRKTEKETIAACASLAQAIKTVLDTPILSKEGKLTRKSQLVGTQVTSIAEHAEEQYA